MSIFIEFHLIQNFAPSNLNRDDTGAPKDAIFGGHRRARISSQCIKRSIRNSPEMLTIPVSCNSVRTKKIVEILETKLKDLGFCDSRNKIKFALSALGLKIEKDWASQMLLFLGHNEIDKVVKVLIKYWDKLDDKNDEEQEASKDEKKNDKKNIKKKAKASAPPGLDKELKDALDGEKAVDVALYGRMLADLPAANQYAACQVAHAISTHRIEREFDYFTASDDYATENENGAAMIGQIEFNAATFYRYAALDAQKLISNLSGDIELALESIRAFVKSSVKAIPSGKQNSFAAHNLPCFIGIVIRNGCLLNLANAFEKPIWPKNDSTLSGLSVEALANHESQLASIYGSDGDLWAYIDMTSFWPKQKGHVHGSLDSLADWVINKVREKLEQ